MIVEALSGLPTEILGHYFGKIADFIGGELTSDLGWKEWKVKHKLVQNKSDFPERYAEALFSLRGGGKPNLLLKFYAQEAVFSAIHANWYGETDTVKFNKDFNDLIHWFTIDEQLADFSATDEIVLFLTSFETAVNQNRTASETKVWQILSQILSHVQPKPNHLLSTLKDKIFIFHNPGDRQWVEKHLSPQLERAGLSVHLDPREHANEDWQILSEKVANCKATVLVFSGKFNRIEQGLIGGLLNERPNKLLALQLGETYVFEEFTNPVSLEAEESRTDSFRPLIARLQSDDLPIWEPLDDKFIEISAMPNGGEYIHLFGRQRELQILDDAWAKRDCRVLSFTAQGGTGKSALFNRWLADMGRDYFRGAGRVLATSFYSQGTGERVTSADQFINFALKWFGERDFEQRSPWDKGKLLAQLVSEHRTLLILDGLEPLQEGGVVDKGKIKDPALFTLIRDLAKRNEGLCIITSRLELSGLERQSAGIRQQNLEHISDEAGKHILRFAGVKGDDIALAKAVREFGNHAFAVNLLGAWLYAQPGHRVETSTSIANLPDVPLEHGRHPRRVIAAFEKLLRENGLDEEVRLLRFLGLFDRPVSEEAIAQLHPFRNLYKTLDNLWMLKLIYRDKRHPILRKNKEDMVDCHPLIREHYSDVFAQEEPEVWQKCHAELYEYYQRLPEQLYGKFLPETLVEMELLYLAMTHGCLAGKQQQVLDTIFLERICRKENFFSTKTLGAFSSDLAALTHLFEVPWVEISQNLNENAQNAVLGWVGFRLLSIGRFKEAEVILKINFEKCYHQNNWQSASVSAENLSSLYCICGDLANSLEYGRLSLANAMRCGDIHLMIGQRTTFAMALHYSGEPELAEHLYKEAESIQGKSQSWLPFLYAIQGYRYNELLLDLGRFSEVMMRGIANKHLEYRSVVDYAFDNLTRGRVHSLLSKESSIEIYSGGAEAYLDVAIEGFRTAGVVSYLPLAILARAAYHTTTHNFPSAEADLEEVLDIAEPTGMRLHLTDYHLETACLRLAQGRTEDAQRHIAEAARLIAETGYHRRDRELEELKQQIEG
ncbi:MAG: TIR domain-containing protein [Saprospiraceae bacterium]